MKLENFLQYFKKSSKKHLNMCRGDNSTQNTIYPHHDPETMDAKNLKIELFDCDIITYSPLEVIPRHICLSNAKNRK